MMKKYIDIILSVIFPRRAKSVNFETVSSAQLLQTSPRAAALTTPRFPARCRAVLSYKYSRTRALVWQIKYKRDSAAIRHGGYVLYWALVEQCRARENPAEKIIIVPIPVSPARRRERGYNQCELLASAMAASAQDKHSQLEIRTDILFRSAHTTRQTLKGRAARLESTQGIFAVHKKYASAKIAQIIENEALKNRPLLVIDDVLTTGSTLREAILTLEKAGFTDVSGLALAH